jgi:putative endonuclease
MKQYFVYILTNRTNKILYTGITDDLGRRLYQHQNKLIDGFTKKYHVNKLVYFEEFNRAIDAIKAEKKIKGCLRSKKIALIESKNPSWKDLSM